MPWRRTLVLGVIVGLAAAAPAAAKDPLPAIAQYVEPMPTSAGTTRGPIDGSPAPPARLSPPVAEQLDREGGRDEAALRAIATEPSLGAPQERLARPRLDEKRDVEAAVAADSTPTGDMLAAVGGSGNRLRGLLLTLLVLTPLLLVAGRRRGGRVARH